MKNGLLRMVRLAMIMAVVLPSTVKAQEKVEASVNVDLVSGYIWRGQDLGGVSIQPGVSLGYKGLSLGIWGSVGFESSDTKEMDITLGYATGGFSVSLTDYWFNRAGDAEADYFDYSTRSAKSSHVFEAQVGYDFKVLSLNWYTNIGGADGVTAKGKRAYSSYISLAAPFRLGSLDWSAEVGATPWETSFYNATGFAVTDVSLGATKSFKIKETYEIPVTVKATWNPRNDRAYLTAAIGF